MTRPTAPPPPLQSPPPPHLSWEEDAAFRHIFLRHFEESDRAALRRVGDMLYGLVLESSVVYGPDLQDVPAITDELRAVAADLRVLWGFLRMVTVDVNGDHRGRSGILLSHLADSLAVESGEARRAPGGGAVMTRPMATPEPFEASAWWGSSPSLDMLTELDAVARVSGRAVEVVVTPFTPPPTLKRSAAGRPIVLLTGDTFHVTSRRELHTVAEEALRRRLASPGGDGEVFDEAQEQAERWQAAQELRP